MSRIEDRVKQFNKKRNLIDKFQGETKPMRDMTGQTIKEGDIIHIPANSLPSPVIVGEVIKVVEAGVIKVPGQPPMSPRIMIAATLVLGPGPDGVLPFVYKVGERLGAAEQEQEQPETPKTIEGLEPENPMDTSTHTDTPLASEAPPEGIELTDV